MGAGLLSGNNQGTFDAIITAILLLAGRCVDFGCRQDPRARCRTDNSILLQQERRTVEVKNEFVSMVSHELRTPITGISGFAETLRDHWRELPPSEVDEFLTILRGESDHLANIVEDILVIPRLDSGHLRFQLEQINVATAAETVTEMVFSDTDIRRDRHPCLRHGVVGPGPAAPDPAEPHGERPQVRRKRGVRVW